MATRKANSSAFANAGQPATRLDFSTGVTRIRKNGIEFHSTAPIPAWTEMTVAWYGGRAAMRMAAMIVISEP